MRKVWWNRKECVYLQRKYKRKGIFMNTATIKSTYSIPDDMAKIHDDNRSISKEALVAAAKYAISESETGECIANEDVESAIASSISKGWNEVHTAIEGKRKLGTADELLSELESSESL